MSTVSMFGKKIALPVVIVGAILAVGAMAALVTYLSNTTTVTARVDSPLAVMSSSGGAYEVGPVVLAGAYGGETETFWIQTENKANAVINANINTTVTNTAVDGASCYDFSKIDITVVETGITTTIWDTGLGINLACSNDGNKFSVMIPAVYVAHETEHYKVDATFVNNVEPSDYTFVTQAMQP